MKERITANIEETEGNQYEELHLDYQKKFDEVPHRRLFSKIGADEVD